MSTTDFSLAEILDLVLTVAIVITFFVIAFRIRSIRDILRQYALSDFEKQEYKKHIACSNCYIEYDINPSKDFICPKCKATNRASI